MNQGEKQILRELASRYMEIAQLPVQREKMMLWKALNRGEMQRPMVLIDQLPWHELNGEGELTLQTQDPVLQHIERDLRQTLYKWNHFPVDMVVEPFITIPKSIRNTGYGIGVEEDIQTTDSVSDVVSHRYHNQLTTEEDVGKIKDMVITHDEAQSADWLAIARDVFDGVAPIRQSAGMQFHLGVWDALSTLMGVENIYYDLMDRPEFLHACMERITSSVLAGIRQAEALGIHNDTISLCHCSHTYTDELLPDFGAGKGPQAKNSWAFGLAQLFSSVSPAVTEEFEIPYITRMAEPFGMIYYGCCDRLDDRLDLVKRIPHVRKVSCSPWSDREAFAERIGPKLVMSNKPTPALLAESSLDTEGVAADIRRTCEAARRNKVNLELILKDISTVHYQPNRLTEWADTAMRVVCE
jgi:hypothetical protein